MVGGGPLAPRPGERLEQRVREGSPAKRGLSCPGPKLQVSTSWISIPA